MDVDAPSPDPQVGEASKEAIQLSRDQFDYQKALLDKYTPLFESQIQASVDAQTKNNLRSDQAWDQYQQHFQPINEKIADTALNYDTQERRDKAAADAAAGVAGTFDTARQGLNEALSQGGVDGSSGKALALGNNLAISEAKAKAGAEAGARQQVEATGQNLMSNAANVGRGLTATGLSTGQMAMGAGNNATGQVQGLSGLSASGLNSSLAGYQVGIGGLTGLNQLQMQKAGQNQAFVGDLLGAGAMTTAMMVAGPAAMMSSEKVKDMGGDVDGEEAKGLISASPAKFWSYQEGQGDGSTQPRLGPTAESLAGTRVSDGNAIDIPSMLGLHHAGLGAVIKDVESLKAEIHKGKGGKKSARLAAATRASKRGSARTGD